MKYQCSHCSSGVRSSDKAMGCNLRDKWFHIGCIGFPAHVYDFTNKSDESAGFNWNCKDCRNTAGCKVESPTAKLKEVVAEEIKKAIPMIVLSTIIETNKYNEKLSDACDQINTNFKSYADVLKNS